MSSQKTVTFRSQTQGTIADFIEDEGLICQASQGILSLLAGELLRYRDEGVELSPTILYCAEAESVLKSFPGSVRYQIGTDQLSPNSMKRILKDCAPLATDSWCIFIERVSSSDLVYGVFDYPALPTALPIDDAIQNEQGIFCLLLRKTSPTTIEMKGSKGNAVSLVFSTTREEASTLGDPTSEFSAVCCSGLTDANDIDELRHFEPYFSRLIRTALNQSHGALLACASGPVIETVAELQDGIPLAPKLDFFDAFRAYRQIGSASALLKLRSCESLLGGILQSDGITLFDPLGCVTAYRVFYRANGSQIATSSPAPVGGARRRAFEGTKGLVGTHLLSVLFRSQDGLTLHEGSTK
jgi:hypothetical protein